MRAALLALAAARPTRDVDQWSQHFFDALKSTEATHAQAEDAMGRAFDEDDLPGVRHAMEDARHPAAPEPEALLGSFVQLRRAQPEDEDGSEDDEKMSAEDLEKGSVDDDLDKLSQLSKKVEKQEVDVANANITDLDANATGLDTDETAEAAPERKVAQDRFEDNEESFLEEPGGAMDRVDRKLSDLEERIAKNRAEAAERRTEEEKTDGFKQHEKDVADPDLVAPPQTPSSSLLQEPGSGGLRPDQMLEWQDWGRTMRDMKRKATSQLQEIYAATAPEAEITDPRLAAGASPL